MVQHHRSIFFLKLGGYIVGEGVEHIETFWVQVALMHIFVHNECVWHVCSSSLDGNIVFMMRICLPGHVLVGGDVVQVLQHASGGAERRRPQEGDARKITLELYDRQKTVEFASKFNEIVMDLVAGWQKCTKDFAKVKIFH